jgi:hypothetical protein
MGQTLTVTVTPGARPEVRNFATDRSITGMAIERFADAASASRATKPANVLARRLFEMGPVRSVAVYSNTVTVEADAGAWAELEPKVTHAIEYLFHYYGDDAGWSVEALEPYGIHRTPSPVQ